MEFPSSPASEGESIERVSKEIEVKFLVDPSRFPEDLRLALSEGKAHPDIIRKGRITQHYLPITSELRAIAFEIIGAFSQSPITETDREFFSELSNIGEIRILQREQDHLPKNQTDTSDRMHANVNIPDAFQITLKGNPSRDGVFRPNIETPITTHYDVCEAVVKLLEGCKGDHLSWQDGVKTIEKMWYDIKWVHPEHPGLVKTVELDIFPDINYLAVAEIEFDSVEEMESFRAFLPQWFHTDLTGNDTFKVRHLAGAGKIEDLGPEVEKAIIPVKDKLMEIYQPTTLGEKVTLIAKQLRESKFVVVGSFKRWLPQIRRVIQDLKRRSAGVYPEITTLDVARRQIDSNDSDVAFRIEAEENVPLEKAEINYLRRIKENDAVYVVAPEGRLGRSSAQEAVYAVGEGKETFFMKNIIGTSTEIPDFLRTLIQSAIRDHLKEASEETLSQTNMTPLFRDNARSLLDVDSLQILLRKNIFNLLRTSRAEDPVKKIDAIASQYVKGTVR